MRKEHHFEGTLRLDAYQFLTNRNNSYFNHHNIEIIRIKVKKTLTEKEIDSLKKILKSSLNTLLRSLEGGNYKNVLHVILKLY